MYYLYDKRRRSTGVEYASRKAMHLFGCRKGHIPDALRLGISQNGTPATEPFAWHLDVAADMDGRGTAIIIDMRPKRGPLLLCELRDVWGYSDSGWTPILMRLLPVILDGDRMTQTVDPIRLSSPAPVEPVHSFMYLRGSIVGGTLIGKWIPSGPSSTNSVLLWPAALRYFHGCISEFDGGEIL